MLPQPRTVPTPPLPLPLLSLWALPLPACLPSLSIAAGLPPTPAGRHRSRTPSHRGERRHLFGFQISNISGFLPQFLSFEMAFRGRGRGRGRVGNDFRKVNPEPFVLFPDIELPDRRNIPRDNEVIRYNIKLRRYFRNSPYYLEETLTDEPESMDIERYSDRAKQTTRFGRGSLLSSGFLMLEPGYFPLELVQGTKRRAGRKVRWNPKQDLQKLDILEQLEEMRKDQDTSTREKGNEEDEEDEENPEEEEEESDEGDYAKITGYDDDEDDFNVNDDVDPDDEHIF